MAELVVSNLGEVELLRLSLKNLSEAPREWKCHLYKNDYTPLLSSVLSDFVEATFPNYDPITLEESVWLNPVSVGGIAQSQYGADPLVWLPSANTGQRLYGYYITFNGGSTLLYSQRFISSVVPTTLLPVTLLLIFTGRSRFGF